MNAGAFTIPESHASLTDSRPILKVIVDVSEPLGYLTSELLSLNQEVGALLPDTTINYIANSLIQEAVSPHRMSSNGQLKNFFHSGIHEQVGDILTKVKGIIQTDLAHNERATEKLIGQSIYPCADLTGIGYRNNGIAVVRYRVGADPLDNLSDDPYAGMDAYERAFNEEEDQLAADDIVHID